MLRHKKVKKNDKILTYHYNWQIRTWFVIDERKQFCIKKFVDK